MLIGMPRSALALVALALLACSSDPETASNGGGGSGASNNTSGASSNTGGASGGNPTAAGGTSSSSGQSPTAGSAVGGQATAGADANGGTALGGEGNAGGAGNIELRLPEANAPFDYQLGGGYTPAAGVKIVTRDREDVPAPGLYNICYVNGFQTQPQDNERWLADHADLVLHDSGGDPVIDEDWGEYLLDTSTETKRAALSQIVGEWIIKCADDGFDAVEIDNLDSYSRSSGLLDEDGNVSFMASLSAVAHAHGLAIGQKNSAELVPRASELGTDFAVAEECNRYSECDAYTAHYGAHVLSIEYRRQDFDKGCQAFPELSIVLRDLDLTTPTSSKYVFDGC